MVGGSWDSQLMGWDKTGRGIDLEEWAGVDKSSLLGSEPVDRLDIEVFVSD